MKSARGKDHECHMKWSFQFFSNLFNTMPILGRYNAMADKLENPLPRYDPTESSSEEPASEQLVWKLKLVALRMSDGETSAVSDVDLSSDGASGSASDPEADEVERGSVDLTLQHLQSMHAMSRRQRELSTYATSGKSQKRVYQRLKNPICKCRCRVPFQALLKICVCFWMLSKQGQDSVLWAIQTEHPGTGCKKDWFIGGSKASKRCFLKVRSTARTSCLQDCLDASAGHWPQAIAEVQECLPGKGWPVYLWESLAFNSILFWRPSKCVPGANGRPSDKAASVHGFFLHMYWSAGEPMSKEHLV